jgi:hypothetical protein
MTRSDISGFSRELLEEERRIEDERARTWHG